jgi:L-malate glycosyltransferase
MQAVQRLSGKQSHWQPTVDWPESRAKPCALRVCFLIDDLAHAGTETQLLALIRHLDRRRVLPYLALLRGGSATSRSLEPMDCPVLRLGVGALARPATIVAAGRFCSFLRRERIHVLQAYFPDSTYFGIPLGWAAGVPRRVRTRNNLGHWLTPTHRFLGRIFNGLTTHTIANCNAATEALRRQEHPDSSRVVVLPNGVDLDRFVRIAAPRRQGNTDSPLIGAVANLRAVKGLDLFIEATARLLDVFPNLRVRVAGEGEHRPVLDQLIRERGLQGKFELVGTIKDVPGFLEQLDIAILCSYAEGMPNAVLEYMAAARPIVATSVGAVTDLIEDGVHGLVVPPGDIASLTRAIGLLLKEPALASKLGEAARNRACRQFSREAMVRRFEDFYEAISIARRASE